MTSSDDFLLRAARIPVEQRRGLISKGKTFTRLSHRNGVASRRKIVWRRAGGTTNRDLLFEMLKRRVSDVTKPFRWIAKKNHFNSVDDLLSHVGANAWREVSPCPRIGPFTIRGKIRLNIGCYQTRYVTFVYRCARANKLGKGEIGVSKCRASRDVVGFQPVRKNDAAYERHSIKFRSNHAIRVKRNAIHLALAELCVGEVSNAYAVLYQGWNLAIYKGSQRKPSVDGWLTAYIFCAIKSPRSTARKVDSAGVNVVAQQDLECPALVGVTPNRLLKSRPGAVYFFFSSCVSFIAPVFKVHRYLLVGHVKHHDGERGSSTGYEFCNRVLFKVLDQSNEFAPFGGFRFRRWRFNFRSRRHEATSAPPNLSKISQSSTHPGYLHEGGKFSHRSQLRRDPIKSLDPSGPASRPTSARPSHNASKMVDR